MLIILQTSKLPSLEVWKKTEHVKRVSKTGRKIPTHVQVETLHFKKKTVIFMIIKFL